MNPYPYLLGCQRLVETDGLDSRHRPPVESTRRTSSAEISTSNMRPVSLGGHDRNDEFHSNTRDATTTTKSQKDAKSVATLFHTTTKGGDTKIRRTDTKIEEHALSRCVVGRCFGCLWGG